MSIPVIKYALVEVCDATPDGRPCGWYEHQQRYSTVVEAIESSSCASFTVYLVTDGIADWDDKVFEMDDGNIWMAQGSCNTCDRYVLPEGVTDEIARDTTTLLPGGGCSMCLNRKLKPMGTLGEDYPCDAWSPFSK